MLDAIGAGTRPRIGDRDWKDIWLDSPEYQNVRAEIQAIKANATGPDTSAKKTSTCEPMILYDIFSCHLMIGC